MKVRRRPHGYRSCICGPHEQKGGGREQIRTSSQQDHRAAQALNSAHPQRLGVKDGARFCLNAISYTRKYEFFSRRMGFTSALGGARRAEIFRADVASGALTPPP